MKNPDYLCYTDGSCKKSEGSPGGWGVFVKGPAGVEIERSGWALETSTLSMELTAIAQALSELPDGANTRVFSDSRSAIDYCTRMLANWKRHDWRTCEVPERELLQKIDQELITKHLQVDWQWLQSHHGNVGNERADELAGEGARQAKREWERLQEEKKALEKDKKKNPGHR